MKQILLAILICVSAFSSNAQDILSLTINNRAVGHTTVNPDSPIVLQVNRSKYKNIKNIILDYKQTIPVEAYKRSIELVDEQEHVIFTSEELPGRPGRFVLHANPILKKLLQSKMLKLFLLSNPRNAMMGMPSRRNLLAELHMK